MRVAAVGDEVRDDRAVVAEDAHLPEREGLADRKSQLRWKRSAGQACGNRREQRGSGRDLDGGPGGRSDLLHRPGEGDHLR